MCRKHKYVAVLAVISLALPLLGGIAGSRRWWEELNAFWRGERHYVGEGLTKQMTEADIDQVRQDVRTFNERLRREQDGTTS